MFRKSLFCLVAALTFGAGLPAGAIAPLIPLDVRPTGTPGTFEVVESRAVGPSHIWCSAAYFARSQLRAGTGQRLYLAAGLGPSQIEPWRKSVVFTLMPDAELAQAGGPEGLRSLLLTLRHPGASLTIAHALQYCTDHLEVN